MAQKPIKAVMLRYYQGEEDKIQVIEGIESSVVLNDFLKTLIHNALSENATDQSSKATQSAPVPVDSEALAKELLPQIRKVFDASLESALARHAISSGGDGGQNTELDEDAQQRIQDGLREMGLKMMGEL
ncbi:MAG: hypothetical protein U9O54_03650 [Chloroflexota bacterium]|nr:hypothetical protein [Chloroflexota bacterium]